MTTQKQIEANRRNSRRSPGPKTRTGKVASKMNAMKHGLLAEQVAVRGEDPVEFAGVLESLIDEFQPQGPLEEQLVELEDAGVIFIDADEEGPGVRLKANRPGQ